MEEILLTEKVPLTEKSRRAGRRLLSEVWNYKLYVVIGIISGFLATALFGSIPLFVKFIVNSIKEQDIDRVKLVCMMIIAAFGVRWAISLRASFPIN